MGVKKRRKCSNYSIARVSQVVGARGTRPLFFPLPKQKKKRWAGDTRLLVGVV